MLTTRQCDGRLDSWRRASRYAGVNVGTHYPYVRAGHTNHQHSPDGATPIVQFVASKKLFAGIAPHLGTALQTPFSQLYFTINFHENPFSHSRERLSHKFW